jgi:hypothetical protein
MNCPFCEHWIDAPPDTEIVVCEKCGKPLEVNDDEN